MNENRLICDDCTSLDEKMKKCPRCNEVFCQHNSSDVDIEFCSRCMNVGLTVTSITKMVHRVNPLTGKETIVDIKKGSSYQFDGTDWLYMMQKIKDFASDPNGESKFTQMVEYHKAIAGMMLSYREDVKQAKMDKLRAEGKSVVKLPSNEDSTKYVSVTISPEAIARKKVIAMIKPLIGGKEPTEDQIQSAMKVFGF